MSYVDGFVIPVPKSKIAAYRKAARQGAALWMKHGALDYRECVADDLRSFGPDGKVVPSIFPKLARLKRNETIVFAYIVFRSRAHRDRVNKGVMGDPKMKDFDPSDMPFDMRRMAYAGFRTLVEAKAGGRSTARKAAPRRRARPRRGARERRLSQTPWPTSR